MVHPAEFERHTREQAFGLSTDTVAPADYDGDGKADVGVWRDSDKTVLLKEQLQPNSSDSESGAEQRDAGQLGL